MKAISKILIASTILIWVSCQKDEEAQKKTDPGSKTPVETTVLEVYLTDSPGDYKAVYVDVQSVEIPDNDTSNGGWKTLDSVNPGIFNLLALTNRLDTIIGKAELPSGYLSQVRLILGEDNSVVLKDGDSIALKTPSGQQSGIKINVNDSLVAGIDYSLVLDFDAHKSVVKAGNSGKYILKPVIRAIGLANNGAIKGECSPKTVSTNVVAISGTDSVGTFTDTTGAFFIQGLVSGTYDVYIDPGSSSGYSDTTISNVSVTNGFITDIGMIQL